MACNCGRGGCSCIIQSGAGIEVLGSGTPTDPYIVSSTILDLGQFLRVIDTETLNLTLTGVGTPEDPLSLRGAVTLKLTDLEDVEDPGGGPIPGEVPIWVGAGAEGHWEFRIPPPSPAGATNVTNGLSGIGSVGDPVRVETSGVWGVGPLSGLGSDSTVGLEIYVDSADTLRARPVGSPSWASITGKPATFPPDAHTHPANQITDQSQLNAGKVNGIKINSTPTSTTPPAGVLGDLWFFPKGA